MVAKDGSSSEGSQNGLFILDASILIDAARYYYPNIGVPVFWDWLLHLGHAGLATISKAVWNKVSLWDDPLGDWLKLPEVVDTLVDLDEEVGMGTEEYVVRTSYGRHFDKRERGKIGEDSTLVALALKTAGTCLVTAEKSSPRKLRHKRKLPDICQEHDIHCIDLLEFVREANFKAFCTAAT